MLLVVAGLDRSLMPPLREEEAVELELTEDEDERPILPKGGRLRSGAGNRTLFFSADMSLTLLDSVLSIGWYELLELPPLFTLSVSGMASSGSLSPNDLDDSTRGRGLLFVRPLLPRTGARTTDNAA